MSAKKRLTFIAIISSLVSATAVAFILGMLSAESTIVTPQPSHWARSLEGECLPNPHQVTPTVYRGGRPTTAGMRQLKAMGVKTVINLRSFNSDRDEIGNTGLAYEHIDMKAWHPERKEIIRFLQIITEKACIPAFVHCQRGAHRAGLMCAISRLAVCGWTKEEASREMTQGGFGYHGVWTDSIKFVDDLNIDAMKKQVRMEIVGSQQPVESRDKAQQCGGNLDYTLRGAES